MATHIPTDNPEQALLFCRRLKSWIETDGGALDDEGLHDAGAKPEVSVVVPIYNEGESMTRLVALLHEELEPVTESFEIVFVNDGSEPPCTALLREMAEKNERVVLVELSRNFGHQVAVSAGIDFAQGDAVAVMDGDLQDPPEVLPGMLARLREGNDVVYAVRRNRKEHWFKRAAYSAFYRVLARVTDVRVPLDAGDFCIMSRRVVDTLKLMPERTRFVRGLRSWVGFKQVGYEYDRASRYAGRSKYTFWRLFFLAVDGVVSLSQTPLRMAMISGFSISSISILVGFYYFTKKLLVGLNPPGFATLITAILFLAGVQLITVGVVGEYVGRIFDEVKQRPLYVVRSTTARKRGSEE